MASIGSPNQISREANEALTKFRFVNILSSDWTKVELIDLQADDDWPLGITEHDCASGEHVDVRTGGVFKLQLSEAITLGQPVAPGPAGKGAIPDVGNYIRAITLQGGDADDIVEVLIVGDPAVSV